MVYKLITIFFLSFNLSAQNFSESFKLKVGESIKIEVGVLSKMSVSRRGIVELAELEGGFWQIIALKPGFVVLKLVYTKSNIEYKLVHVENNETKKNKKDEFSNLCEQNRLECMQSTLLILGEISDYNKFYAIQNRCKMIKGCNFSAKLSNFAKSAYESDLSEYFYGKFSNNLKIVVQDEGSVYLAIPCLNEENEEFKFLQKVSQSFSSKGSFILSCLKENKATLYHVFAKVVLAKIAQDRSIGFAASSNVLEAAKLNIISKESIANLDVLAAPEIIVLSGTKARVQSGGEFTTTNRIHKEDLKSWQESGWKEYGLAFTMQVDGIGKTDVLLDYEFSLSQPGAEKNFHSLHTNKFSGILKVKIGEETNLGSVELHADQNEKKGIPILSNIPIVAPLFNFFQKDQIRSKIYLQVRVLRT